MKPAREVLCLPGDHTVNDSLNGRPIGNSYWLVDGEALAGEYPGSVDPVEAAARLPSPHSSWRSST